MAATTKSHDFLDPPSQSGDLGTLGHYRVKGELGKGGMGFVFRAEDIKLKRSVALKVMNQKIAATPNSRRRFIHEARAMAAVHHDNVATIFEVGESNGTPFMAMEMLKGKTLETFNRSKTQLDFETIIDYAKHIARGLSAAHAKGIVHRDIKPANIWIEEGTDRIKILDFGLALASTPVDHLSGRGAVIGTPGYLSPEQARSEPLDDRSDLYSLGVVLYELCTGQLPIQSKSVPGQLVSILAHRPQPINEINPEIPQPLCDLVHRLLRKEPRSRPASATKLEAELDHVEGECHAKSEVAQAINKLQMGLSQVVNQKSADNLFDTVEEVHETIPDPLAATPAPVTMVPPARPIPRRAGAATTPAWQAYWPLAAIGALVLIAIPVLIFAFAGSGGSEVAAVPAQGDPVSPSPTPVKNDNQAQSKPKPNTPTPAARQNTAGQNRKNQGKGKQTPKTQNKANSDAANNNVKMTSVQSDPGSSAPPKKTNPKPAAPKSAPAKSEPPPKPEPKPDPKPVPSPQPSAVDMHWTAISTGDGRGADAEVKKGSSQKLGLKPSLGIGSRKDIETNHTYLRFDLAGIEEVRSHVKSAELYLALVGGDDQSVNATIQVFGIANLGLWPEQILEWKKSFSSQGLDKFPLLAVVTVSNENVVRIEGGKAVRIATPELAQFVAASPIDTVTLVLSGSGSGNEVVRFISRESPSGKSPRLRLETPREPPPDDKKKNKR